MKATLLRAVFAAVAVFGLAATSVLAASSSTVSATVTVTNISLTVTDGSISYGTIAASGTQDTTTAGINDSQTATNNGNLAEDFNIRGLNSAGWTLGATAGSDQYFHKFCTSNCDSSPTWTALTTSNQQLANAVGTSGTSVFDLQIGAPSSTSTFAQQSVDVVVQAVQD